MPLNTASRRASAALLPRLKDGLIGTCRPVIDLPTIGLIKRIDPATLTMVRGRMSRRAFPRRRSRLPDGGP